MTASMRYGPMSVPMSGRALLGTRASVRPYRRGRPAKLLLVPSVLDKPVHAVRYTWGFERFTARQHARHGTNWTLRLPGLEDSVVTSDRELIKTLLTGDPLERRHA